jgi:redox-sensitive bicupin YhaK (pirin superfamily)
MAYSSAMRTGSFVVISVVDVVTISLLVVAAMNDNKVVGADEKNGGLWCSPMENTSSPTSSVFCAIRTTASIRSASLGVSPETGSRVMSLTEKTPNCMARLLECPPHRRLRFTLPVRQVYAFACILTGRVAAIFRGETPLAGLRPVGSRRIPHSTRGHGAAVERCIHVSNLETGPRELVGADAAADEAAKGGQVLRSRAVPLGGPRAMTVRRTLPQRKRSLIGAWCFADHYGPDDVSVTGGMQVAGHPHTGLQTVSWLFRGEIEHRDTTGAHTYVRPGELNLMTAGAGVAHSEYSTPATTVLHGVQLWVALPEAHRFTAPAFEHYAPPPLDLDGARVLVFLGSLAGSTSPVRTFSPLLGAEIALGAGHKAELAIDPTFEHGVLVDTGRVTVAGATADPGELIYQPVGSETLSLQSSPEGQARVLLLGGEPLAERIVMWWNFIGRSHDEIAAYRAQWQAERAGNAPPGNRRYGTFPSQWDHTLPAPELPNARLRPRE